MEVINDSPLCAAWIVGKIQPPQWSMTCLVKGTFQLKPGSVAVLADKQADLTGDEYVDKDLNKLLRYPSDFAYFKPHTDLLLMGTCYSPGAKPFEAVPVRFRVGSYEKVLMVVGDRMKEGFKKPSNPQSFQKMPVTYEQAYGGAGFEKNPLGKGHNPLSTPNGKQYYPFPNIETPQDLEQTQPRRDQPAGFGPIPQTWPQRVKKMGSFNDKWLKERWPWMPEDFDWGFFNSAPKDQQLQTPLNGDETVYVENLHPQHPQYRSQLPGVRARCFLQERVRASLQFREVPMKLDTLWVDMDKEQLILVWRGWATVRTEKLEEILYFFVASEPVSEPPKTVEHYRDALVAALLRAEEEDEELEPAEEEDLEEQGQEEQEDVEEEAEPEEVQSPAEAGEINAVVPVAMQQAKAGGAAPPPPEAPLEAPPPEVEASEPPEPPEEPDDDELTVDRVMELIKRKENLEGAELSGLNLSGVDLSGMNLRNTVFEEVILYQANLAGADLSGATLAGIDLREADCQGANFSEADLCEAQMVRCDLSRAVLQEADLTQADLREAKLEGVQAKEADFSGADLSGANLREAVLIEADLSGCRLHRADLTRAVLTEASIEKAWGRKVQAEEAQMEKLKAAGANLCEGNFRRIQGKGSIWEMGEYYGADFSQADLSQAEFSGSYLGWAKFNATDLTDAVFDEATLVHAELVRAKLLDASIQKANLTQTNLLEANLYEANLCLSDTTGTNFKGANLKMLKHTMKE